MRRRNSYIYSEDGPPRKKISDINTLTTVDIKPGEVLTDLTGKQWKLGKAIGIGGFGEIFLASDNIDNDSEPSTQYVAKVETHTNGPLFVEINCYLRIARQHMIEEWKDRNELDTLGMPVYIASGSHQTKNTKLRFLIIPKFDKDLEQVFQSKKRKFNLKTVLILAVQLLNTLEYIHSHGYVHSDIKASNILLQNAKKDRVSKRMVLRYTGTVPLRNCRVKKLMLPHLLRPNGNLKYYDLPDDNKIIKKDVDQVYLLDYGLASKYVQSNGEHKEFCSDERKAHAGTILFCSLDAHKGAQSRRSDLESLGYNIVYWLTSKLPWMDDAEEPEIVHKKKQKCLMNLDEFLKCCFSSSYPKFLYEYFKYLVELGFQANPDYDYCRSLFERALKEYGYKANFKFDFDNSEGWGKKQKRIKINAENKRSPKLSYKLNRIPLTSNLPLRPELRKKSKAKKNKLNWSKILIDPEIILKQKKARDRKITETSDCCGSIFNLNINQLNPTYAMIEVYNKSLEKTNSGSSPRYKGDSCSDCLEGYTPAMMMVHNRKKEREELELEKMVVITRKSHNKINNRTSGRNKIKRPILQSGRTRSSKSSTDTKKDTVKKQKSVVNTRAYRLRG